MKQGLNVTATREKMEKWEDEQIAVTLSKVLAELVNEVSKARRAALRIFAELGIEELAKRAEHRKLVRHHHAKYYRF
jgi:hypothetical protein